MTTWEDGPVRVLVGKAEDVLPTLPDASCEALVTDPPGGIEFMARTWDSDHGGRSGWVSAHAAIFRECLRVLKPGAHGLVWAIPRTSHWTATALEDAGFEIRDIVHHHFGSGFPKNGKVSLKPATEHWVLVRKPLSEANVAANVLEHGTGALNVDGCRIAGVRPTVPQPDWSAPRREGTQDKVGVKTHDLATYRNGELSQGNAAGRWPANLVLSHAEGCRPVGTRRVASDGHWTNRREIGRNGIYGRFAARDVGQGNLAADPDGLEIVKAWDCAEGCPVAELDRQSGVRTSGFMAAGTQREGLGYRGGLGSRVRNDTIGDSGGASRFFYVSKASPADRNIGLPPGLRNRHSTVKPVELMRWLCRLVTPPGGLVLDCFAGSGTTLVAAKLEGFQAIGVEQDAEWLEVIKGRVAWANHQPSLLEVP